jgi:hypothetical protein
MTGKGALGSGIIALTIVLSVIYGIHSAKAEAKAEKRGMTDSSVCRNTDEEWVKIPASSYKDHAGDCIAGTPPAPPPPPRMVEALVLEHECNTPCSAFVGWSYKVRTDGDSIRIKYQGCTDWFDQPAKEDKPAPKCFQPGEAQFASPLDEKVKVWVYKRITVQGGQ